MLTLLYGTNIATRRTALVKETARVSSLGLTLVAMHDTEFRSDFFEMVLGGQSLFGERYALILSGVLENKELSEKIVTQFKALAQSPNEFIFVDTKLPKDILTKCEKAGGVCTPCIEVTKQGRSGFPIFSLADAFGARDRKTSWLLLRDAFDYDIAPEEIHGVLFWQLKALLLAHPAQKETVASSGLNPYVFKKAQGFARNFEKSELENLSREFVRMYHDAHRGLLDLEIELERALLNLL